ncbi:type I secretion system permease/ATPase [Guyparkeria sp.]|uniref:type I secretion system permease/ATPase n=1 Tax=Guyparkeria sp. TaxID=2035736 RepID=UPI0039705244
MERDDPIAACILDLAVRHGRPMTYEALVSGLPRDEGRVTPALLPRAAERAGFEATFLRQKADRLNPAILPCIVLLSDDSAAVLDHIDKESGKVLLRVPEFGMQPALIDFDEFEGRYDGVAVHCHQPFRLESANDEQTGPHRERGHWFWRVIRDNRPLYRDVLVAALFINLFALALPLFVMNVYDRVVPNQSIETLWVLATGVFVVIVADLALRLLRSWFIERAARKADVRLSASIMERLLGGRMEDAPGPVGSMASNVHAFEAVRSFIGSLMMTSLIDLPFFFLFLGIIAIISPWMALPAIIGALALLSYALIAQRKLYRLSEIASQAGAQRNAGLVESLGAIETLKTHNAEGRAQEEWEDASRFLAACSARQRLLGGSIGTFGAWVQQTVSVSMIIIGVYLVFDSAISVGALIAAYLLSSRAMAPLTQSASTLTQYHHAFAALRSLDGLMEAEPERDPGRIPSTPAEARGEIRFERVGFSYPDANVPVLEDVTLRIRPGEKVGIIGRAGSGKSTLARLILGLYRPTAGKLMVDGMNIEQADVARLRASIGHIAQDVDLVSGTLYENITLGLDAPDRGTVEQALRIAGLDRMTAEDVEGLAMPVGERGRSLSGGQRQAVAVARAVARASHTLVMDEPTSSMDSQQENRVANGLRRFARDRTVVLITHRSRLLTLVDRLVVMDRGRVIADGPKAEILKALERGEIRGAM